MRLIVNDYWAWALEYDCYGVHLGQSDLADVDWERLAGSDLRLGISTHGWWELARALSWGPSYVAYGPVHATDSKPMDFAPTGLERFAAWARVLAGHCPLAAIGGIHPGNAAPVWAAGADGVAFISALTRAADPAQALQGMRPPL